METFLAIFQVSRWRLSEYLEPRCVCSSNQGCQTSVVLTTMPYSEMPLLDTMTENNNGDFFESEDTFLFLSMLFPFVSLWDISCSIHASSHIYLYTLTVAMGLRVPYPQAS